ncbi:MAG: hypothetical protein RML93_11670 [Anaerolineales bacterium]|nr:hypothetical protein [Anaerolineales bacterium]MDW8447933.1 hypothetical protein [Anaerolineales bacterium]
MSNHEVVLRWYLTHRRELAPEYKLTRWNRELIRLAQLLSGESLQELPDGRSVR